MKQHKLKRNRSAKKHGDLHSGEVVCFGYVVPAYVLIVDEFPEHNAGAVIKQVAEFISDDAAIVACLLRGWNVRSGLIGSALGADERGRKVVRELEELGVVNKLRVSKSITTPIEVNISDRTGARTYFWQRDSHLLDTLDTADLSLLANSRMLYVDWYDGHHILRAMAEAYQKRVPVFLNIEYGHADLEILDAYAPRARICQAVTDPAQREGDAVAIARKLLTAGVETALVTLGGDGCVAARGDEMIRAYAPSVHAVDGCGAGATFSAGFIYAHLRGWHLEKAVRFAVAAGSLKVTRVGLKGIQVEEIEELMRKVRIERMKDEG